MTMHNKRIIGLCGLIGSGKSECARILVECHGFKKISLGSRLKDVVSVLFDWPRNLLEGDTMESRAWRETELPEHNMTPRQVLQLIGTNALRDNFDPNIWAKIVKRQIEDSPHDKFVIDDIRFTNEINIIMDNEGSSLWHVMRDNQLVWWDAAIEAAKRDQPIFDEMGKPLHASEISWIKNYYKVDAVIKNDESLKERISSLIS